MFFPGIKYINTKNNGALKITIIYIGISILWHSINHIFFSIEKDLWHDILFTLFSSVFFYFLLNKYLTKLKLISKNLIQNKELFQLIFENAPIGIGIYNMSNHLIDSNLTMQKILGYSEEELNNSSLSSFTHPDDYKKEIELLNELKEGNIDKYQLEKRSIRKTGSLIWVKVIRSKINHPENNEGYYISLAEDISERKKIEEQLKNAIKDRDFLMKEIHHRVKNNFQIIFSLLNMQKKMSKNPEVIKPLEEAQRRIKSMAVLHQKFYKSTDISSINFTEFISAIVDELSSSFITDKSKVSISLNLSPVILNMHFAVPCGLIINELLTNIFKYAFPIDFAKKGEITISLSEDEKKEVTLLISDNGIGIPETINPENVTSLGMTLILNLIQQIEGKYILERTNGTSWNIIFKNQH